MSGKWCDASGLQGSVFSYSGGPARGRGIGLGE